jgi:hypothetical protein
MTSGKRSKQLRREKKESGQKPQPTQAQHAMPPIVKKIMVNVHSDGNVSVQGFPDSYQDAVGILMMAQQAVSLHFMQLASEGKLNKNYVKDEQRIITPQQAGKLIVPG